MRVTASHRPRFCLRLSTTWRTDYPECLLREWVTATLAASRCSADYLEALRVVLGNMALADRLGSRLWMGATQCFASRQVLRTILLQLHAAGLVRRVAGAMLYQGAPRPTPLTDGADLYTALQRETEDADFMRFRAKVGLCVGDIPY